MFKIEVTPDPSQHPLLKDGTYIVKNYSAIINACDTPCLTFTLSKLGFPSFWFPIDELDCWRYSPFYGAAKVIDQYKNQKPIIIHCHAGANRSPTIAYAILKAEDLSESEIKSIIGFDALEIFQRNVDKYYIPRDIIEFLKNRKKYPNASILDLRGKTDYASVQKSVLFHEPDMSNVSDTGSIALF